MSEEKDEKISQNLPSIEELRKRLGIPAFDDSIFEESIAQTNHSTPQNESKKTEELKNRDLEQQKPALITNQSFDKDWSSDSWEEYGLDKESEQLASSKSFVAHLKKNFIFFAVAILLGILFGYSCSSILREREQKEQSKRLATSILGQIEKIEKTLKPIEKTLKETVLPNETSVKQWEATTVDKVQWIPIALSSHFSNALLEEYSNYVEKINSIRKLLELHRAQSIQDQAIITDHLAFILTGQKPFFLKPISLEKSPCLDSMDCLVKDKKLTLRYRNEPLGELQTGFVQESIDKSLMFPIFSPWAPIYISTPSQRYIERQEQLKKEYEGLKKSTGALSSLLKKIKDA